MSYTGKWKRTKFENHVEILKHIGMPKEVAEKMKSVENILEIKHEGNTFDEVWTFGDRVRKEVLVVGKPSKHHTWNDSEVEVIPEEIAPGKIKLEYDHNGVHHCGIREKISDIEFVDHINLDNGIVTGKIVYTKV